MTALIVLVDDLRRFRDGRPCRIARDAQHAIDLLREPKDHEIDELRLDHDLSSDRRTGRAFTAIPINELVAAAATGDAYRIGSIRLHTANPRGAVNMRHALEEAGCTARRRYDNRIWVNRRQIRDPLAHQRTRPPMGAVPAQGAGGWP